MTGYRMIKDKGRAIRKIANFTQQDVWKTQDGRITKTSSARLCIPGLARHFPVILPSSCVRSLLGTLSQDDGNGNDDTRKKWSDWLNEEK